MVGNTKDLIGMQFGRWIVIRRAQSRPSHSVWLCRCECGTVKEVYRGSLVSGTSKSCGCRHREIVSRKQYRHGLHRSSEYQIWADIIQRCSNPRNNKFSYYGGRGINVCTEWHSSFENFYRDMGPRPSVRHSIDRIDNNIGYSPHNCRWATRIVQQNNTRLVHRITFRGESHTLREWSEITGISLQALRGRRNRNWPLGKMLTTPNIYVRETVLREAERAA